MGVACVVSLRTQCRNAAGRPPPFVIFTYVLFPSRPLQLRTPHTFSLGKLVFPASKIFQLEIFLASKKWEAWCGAVGVRVWARIC